MEGKWEREKKWTNSLRVLENRKIVMNRTDTRKIQGGKKQIGSVYEVEKTLAWHTPWKNKEWFRDTWSSD